MDLFDDTIKDIHEWLRQKRNEGQVRQYNASAPGETAGSSSDRHDRAETNPVIILKEDTHLELGHPSVGSCSATIATSDPSLVDNGRITLVGPDISEADEEKLPFAQVAIACCRGDIEETSSMMDRVLHVCAQIDGYMLRSVPNQIWARVSKEAASSGFSMRRLGLRLISSLNNECTGITKSEILFVTSSREDVSALDKIVAAARDRLRKLQTFERRPDGTYECTTSLDCDECPEKPVCDTVREVITIRKGDRVITLGENGRDETK